MASGDLRAFVRANLPDPPARVLEIGAGDGRLSRALRALGYDMVAIDPKSANDDVRPVDDQRARNAGLAQRVRFVSISLDPTNDTPEAIRGYRDMILRESALEWDVLTARTVRDLLPVLDDFGQDVSVEQAPDGTPRRTVHHMLKMFLIDRTGVVREIYTLAFLEPLVMLNDIQTLYLEEKESNTK